MKILALSSLAAGMLLSSTASASIGDRYDNDRYDDRYSERHDSYDRRYDDRYDDRYGSAGYGRFDTARVVHVQRLGNNGRDYRRNCGRYDRDSGINEGAVVGAVIGGVIGNQAGRGDGRVAATVAGAAIGGLIGQSIDRDQRGGYDRHVVECRNDGWNGRSSDYRVTYRYHGRNYTTIMPYHPGDRVRIRVDAVAYNNCRVSYRY
ncbi:MAG: glycine zipper 2TM domain-containing protein [Arenimonas sp.]